jgi:hypothetical protein
VAKIGKAGYGEAKKVLTDFVNFEVEKLKIWI